MPGHCLDTAARMRSGFSAGYRRRDSATERQAPGQLPDHLLARTRPRGQGASFHGSDGPGRRVPPAVRQPAGRSGRWSAPCHRAGSIGIVRRRSSRPRHGGCRREGEHAPAAGSAFAGAATVHVSERHAAAERGQAGPPGDRPGYQVTPNIISDTQIDMLSNSGRGRFWGHSDSTRPAGR